MKENKQVNKLLAAFLRKRLTKGGCRKKGYCPCGLEKEKIDLN